MNKEKAIKILQSMAQLAVAAQQELQSNRDDQALTSWDFIESDFQRLKKFFEQLEEKSDQDS